MAQPFQGPTVPQKRHLSGSQPGEHGSIAWEMFFPIICFIILLSNKFSENKPSFQEAVPPTPLPGQEQDNGEP